MPRCRLVSRPEAGRVELSWARCKVSMTCRHMYVLSCFTRRHLHEKRRTLNRYICFAAGTGMRGLSRLASVSEGAQNINFSHSVRAFAYFH
jgi:hypothetical protein